MVALFYIRIFTPSKFFGRYYSVLLLRLRHLDAHLLKFFKDFTLAGLQKHSLVGIKVTEQGEQLAHVRLLLITDVCKTCLDYRIISCLDMCIVAVDGIQLTCEVCTNRLCQLGIGHLAGNNVCKRIS